MEKCYFKHDMEKNQNKILVLRDHGGKFECDDCDKKFRKGPLHWGFTSIALIAVSFDVMYSCSLRPWWKV